MDGLHGRARLLEPGEALLCPRICVENLTMLFFASIRKDEKKKVYVVKPEESERTYDYDVTAYGIRYRFWDRWPTDEERQESWSMR